MILHGDERMKLKAHLSGVGFAIIFGCSFLASKLALQHISPLGLLAYRFLLAFIVFEVLRLTKIIHISFSKSSLKLLGLVVLCQPVLYFLFETFALKLTTSSEAGMMIALIPIVVVILSTTILKEKPSLPQLIAIILSIVGIIFIQASNFQGEFKIIGFMLLLGAVISASFFNILSRKASALHAPHEVTYFMALGGALVFNICYLIELGLKGSFGSYFTSLGQWNVVLSIGYLGIFSSVLGFFLVNYSLSKLTAPASSLYSNLATVITMIAGVLFLSEQLTVYHLIGASLILIGVYLSVVATKRLVH